VELQACRSGAELQPEEPVLLFPVQEVRGQGC